MRRSTLAKLFLAAIFILVGLWFLRGPNSRDLETIRKNSEIPLDVNPLVQAQINRILYSPKDFSAFMCGMKRFERYGGLVTKILRDYGLPLQFRALPMSEIYYQNVYDTHENAGIWHILLYEAKIDGLLVDDKVDERLDLTRSSDIASRILLDLQKLTHDPRQSILAYRFGITAVLDNWEVAGKPEVWKFLGTQTEMRDYLALYLADAILMDYYLMKKPSAFTQFLVNHFCSKD